LGAFAAQGRKPGFPHQFLGFARLHGRAAILLCKIATSPMQILRDFRCNPLRAQGLSPIRPINN
jgi:hypothetical protein